MIPARIAPTIGATQKTHNCSSAQPPTKTAGPVLRAGFTERFVTGIPIRWTKVKPRPIAIGAKPAGARTSVAPKMINKNLMEIKDVDGKAFIKERVEMAKKKSPFWQDYKFTNPVSGKIEPKTMYCIPEEDLIVCGGVYLK